MMPIDIYISTNGKNPYSKDTQQTEEIQVDENATKQVDAASGEEIPASAGAGVAKAASNKLILLAAVKMAASMAKKVASKAISFYTDQTGDITTANKYNAMIGNFDIVKETLNIVKTYAREQSRLRYIRDRSGNTTLNGSRYSND